jgi:hypothetical protein
MADEKMTVVGTVSELWVYPVKGCRGTRVFSSPISHEGGLEFDRAFCVVDLDGVIAHKYEAISKRVLPGLATIVPVLSEDRSSLTLKAPGMNPLTIPTDADKYSDFESVMVEASQKSAKDGKGWSLGKIKGCLHPAASKWVSDYINRPQNVTGGLRISGKSKTSRFGFVRSVSLLPMETYPPIFPVLEKALDGSNAEYAGRIAGQSRRYSNFSTSKTYRMKYPKMYLM